MWYNWKRALTIDCRSQGWFPPPKPHNRENKKGKFPLASPKLCSPNMFCPFSPPTLRCLFLPFPCSAQPAQHSPQMVGDGCDSHGYRVPFSYCAVRAVAAGSVRPGLFAEAATSPKASHASALCPLSCSLTVLPPALIQWGFGVGLFLFFIMHQSRKQWKQKLS